jgi:uncharacterized protein with PIN domain
MTVTPIEISFGAKAISFVRKYWGRVFVSPKRVATLEERISALEESLKTAPPDACPYCGERAMRLTYQSSLLGNQGHQWTEETWTCEKCGKKYSEREKLKAR